MASVKQCYNKGLHVVLYMLGQRAKQPSDAWHAFRVLHLVNALIFAQVESSKL